MTKVTIEQLDSNGNVYRTFTRHTKDVELESVLYSISRAFNMAHTRVHVG